jgi:hypothetical protein
MSVTRRQFIQSLGAVAGAATCAQFDRRLEALARALSGPQEWVLSFDESELTDLIKRGIYIGDMTTDERGRPAVECALEFETPYLWALATLTDPDGGEWVTVDGETWTQGDETMRHCGVCEMMRQGWGMDDDRCDACCWDALYTEAAFG